MKTINILDPYVEEDRLWVFVLSGVDVNGFFLSDDSVGVVHVSEYVDLEHGTNTNTKQKKKREADSKGQAN